MKKSVFVTRALKGIVFTKNFFYSVTDSLAFCKPFKLLSDDFAVCIYFKTNLLTEEPEVMEVINEAINTAIERVKKGESFSKVAEDIVNELKKD